MSQDNQYNNGSNINNASSSSVPASKRRHDISAPVSILAEFCHCSGFI